MTRPTADRTKQALGHRSTIPKFGVLSLIAAAVLTACSPATEGSFSFSPRSDQTQTLSRLPALSQARFADGEVVLVAPPGHCVDPSMLRQEADGGFALLPRCNLLQGPSWFGRNRAALITATIGPAKKSGAPSTIDLARTAAGAKLLYYDNNGMLPLVRLHWPGHGATGTGAASGASAEHWRGAFVLNDHLVVLALYAPEGSDLLGDPGAALLSEMTRLTLEASLIDHTPEPQADVSAAQLVAPALRPRSRPVSEMTDLDQSRPDDLSAPNAEPRQKLSLRRRIAGLFQ